MLVGQDIDGLDGDVLVFPGENGLAACTDTNLVLDELAEDEGLVVKNGKGFLKGTAGASADAKERGRWWSRGRSGAQW